MHENLCFSTADRIPSSLRLMVHQTGPTRSLPTTRRSNDARKRWTKHSTFEFVFLSISLNYPLFFPSFSLTLSLSYPAFSLSLFQQPTLVKHHTRSNPSPFLNLLHLTQLQYAFLDPHSPRSRCRWCLSCRYRCSRREHHADEA